MNILIVEDDENKRVQIGKFLEESGLDKIEYARSLQSGVRRIRKRGIDLVILDMTLPNFDASPDEPGGETTHSFGGREFLKQVDRFEIEVPVVVVTQFETFGKSQQAVDLAELDSQLRVGYPEVYKGCVYYHASIAGWKDALALFIDGLRKTQ